MDWEFSISIEYGGDLLFFQNKAQCNGNKSKKDRDSHLDFQTGIYGGRNRTRLENKTY